MPILSFRRKKEKSWSHFPHWLEYMTGKRTVSAADTDIQGLIRMKDNNSAFDILVHEHHRRAFSYALAISPSRDVAEDLVQESFLIAHEKLDQFDTTRDFGAWIRGIIQKRFLKWCEQRPEHPIDPHTIEEIAHFHSQLEQADSPPNEPLMMLGDCLEELPPAAGRVVDLFYFQREPGARIAASMGTTEATIRKRLQRARKKLADCIRLKILPGGAGS